ncbi:hypothetical protein G7Y89_g547 [Cudoniella acicularis]|uniref:Uncharacterized protein n=1 Tax=Cudoniella acicularis TaxID=354080 RepID=A0A8H4RZQ5_9HELO|nr:hypothetical protein G7Y89_g547 [Cudoniella acicularis]
MSHSALASAIGSPTVFPHSDALCSTIVPSNRRHSWSNFPSLSNHTVSRSHSHNEDDRYSNRNDKHSRSNSTNSTSLSSPTFSHDLLLPTPEHATLATSMHSLHIYPCGDGYDLPEILSLSLQQTPALTPMEPHVDGQCHTNNQATSAPQPRSVISDIMSRTEGTERILPALQAREMLMVPGQHLVDDFMARLIS